MKLNLQLMNHINETLFFLLEPLYRYVYEMYGNIQFNAH